MPLLLKNLIPTPKESCFYFFHFLIKSLKQTAHLGQIFPLYSVKKVMTALMENDRSPIFCPDKQPSNVYQVPALCQALNCSHVAAHAVELPRELLKT